MQDFMPMNSKLESERLKRPRIQLDKERFKKLKTTEASGQIGKENLSSTAVDSNPSQPLASTTVDTELHKEVQQAPDGPTSLGVTSKERAHPQLGNNASADFTTKVDPEISAPNDSIPHQQGPDEGSKNNTPDHTFARTNPSVLIDKIKFARDGSQTAHTVSGTKVDTRSAFMDDKDEHFNALEKSNEEHAKRIKYTHVETKRTSLIPTELKELFTKITSLSREVNELKKHIKEFEVELPEFKLISRLWKHSSCLFNKVTDTLNMFASILNAHNNGVPSAGKSTASPAEDEKNTNPVIKDVELENLVDLMGIDVLEEYRKKVIV
nr:hypothetical protein [Tanacetum cinerariifolium]